MEGTVTLLILDAGAICESEGLRLTGLISAAEADLDATPAQVVEDRDLLGQPKRMVEGDDVGQLPQADTPRQRGHRRADLERVGAQLGPLDPEVMLGQPEVVEPDPVGDDGPAHLGGLTALVGVVELLRDSRRPPAVLTGSS